MSQDGRLRVTLVDAYGHAIQEPTDIFLSNRMLTHNIALRAQNVMSPLLITGLVAAPTGLYRIEISAPSYYAVAQFVNIPASAPGELTIMLPINPRRVTGLHAPEFEQLPAPVQELLARSSKVLDFAGCSGREFYDALDNIRKAGLLNLTAKSAVTRFSNERNVLSYLREILELRGDRFFAVVDRELRSQTANSVNDGLVQEVNGALHTPPPGYERDRSFKSMDHYGNIQLSFFRNAAGEYAVDIDIDDAQGFEHAFQVVRNTFSGPTHPYNIHEVLLAKQHLDSGYELLTGQHEVAQA
jgi:hypothetical protein